MPNLVRVNTSLNAEDLLTLYSAGAKVYLYSAATEAGSYTLVGSGTALVSGTEQYEIVDANGTSSTWYKHRFGNSGATVFSDYSPTFQAGGPNAYATLDDVRRAMQIGTSHEWDAYLSDLLVDVSAQLDAECERDFYRHPALTGDETRYYDISRSGLRALQEDIISLTTLSISDVTGGTYTAITAGSTGYFLDPYVPPTGWPYTTLRLSDLGSTYLSFPRGSQIIKAVGAFGWPSIPAPIHRAVIDMVREQYRQGPGGGGPVGVSALGQPIFGPIPRSWLEAVRIFKRRRFSEYV